MRLHEKVGFVTTRSRTQQAHPTLVRFLLTIARPVLRVHLWTYNRNMRSAVFPGDMPERALPGADPDRVLFVGDIAVAGYGVLLEGMGLPAQTAARMAQAAGRGVLWENVGAYNLSVDKAAAAITGHLDGVDVVVVALGIPDVLLVTNANQWQQHLAAVIHTIRQGVGGNCRIVLAGLPPMHRFQPLPPVAHKVIQAQVRRLDSVMVNTAAKGTGVTFVPFPDLQLKQMFMRDAFSFRAMHQIWAEALAPHLVESPHTREPPRRPA